MLLTDVNVLIHAFREDSSDHERYRDWLRSAIHSDTTFGVSDLVLSGFLRVVTNPRAFAAPARLDDALAFARMLREAPGAARVTPGPTHWDTFVGLCEQVGARGNLIPDAYLAALAIENGAEFITTDGDFARFPGLRWRHPLRG